VRANSPLPPIATVWTARQARRFESRLRLVTRQLARAPICGRRVHRRRHFGDLALTLAMAGGHPLGEVELAYRARTTARDAYKRPWKRARPQRAGSPAGPIGFAGDEVSAHPVGCARNAVC